MIYYALGVVFNTLFVPFTYNPIPKSFFVLLIIGLSLAIWGYIKKEKKFVYFGFGLFTGYFLRIVLFVATVGLILW